jgi:hypothetical protein
MRRSNLVAWAGLAAVVVLLTVAWTPSSELAPSASNPSQVVPTAGSRPATAAPIAANWSTLNEPVSPSERAEDTFTWATFGGKQEGVLFGGRGNFSVLDNDTWVFTNGTWRELHLAVEPLGRRGAMAAFDPLDGYVVLFGGSTGTAFLNDTWVFNGSGWRELFPPVSPAARRVGGFAWDAADQYLVLFSGHNGTSLGVNANFTTIDDTWTFVHGIWAQLHPPVQPLGRSEPSEVFDTALDAIVVFGGYTTQPSYLAYNDTWMFRAGIWTPVILSVAPSPRDGAPMAYDPALNASVLEGGQNETGNASTLELNDTWVLLGTSLATLAWQLVDVVRAPLPADSAAMVFDPQLDTVLVFGGHSGEHAVTWYNTTSILTLSLTAQIVANQTVGAPLSFSFSEVTQGGLGPYSYEWNFGDKTTSNSPTPMHPYVRAGTYVVTLNATDSVGNHATTTLNVTAFHRLKATLSESAGTVMAGNPLTLNVSSSGGLGPLTYLWSGLPRGCVGVNESYLNCSPTSGGQFLVAVNITDVHNDTVMPEQNLTVVGNTNPGGNSTLLKVSKFPAWVFAAGGVVVLALVLGLILWRREQAQAAAKRRAPAKKKPPPRTLGQVPRTPSQPPRTRKPPPGPT